MTGLGRLNDKVGCYLGSVSLCAYEMVADFALPAVSAMLSVVIHEVKAEVRTGILDPHGRTVYLAEVPAQPTTTNLECCDVMLVGNRLAGGRRARDFAADGQRVIVVALHGRHHKVHALQAGQVVMRIRA